MRKPSIPEAPHRPGREFDERVKENIETMQARRPGVARIAALPDNATTAEVIAKVNELIERLQA